MKIFGRFDGDHPAERLRYEERLKKARRSIREDYDRVEKAAVGLFILCFALVIALGVWGDSLPIGAVWTLGTAAALTLIAAFIGYCIVYYKTGDDGQTDLYIYGMDGDDFLLLNPLYEELDRVSPAEVEEIRILSAMRPTTRQRYMDHRGIGVFYQNGDATTYEYFGETGEDGAVTPLPMAVLCAQAKDFDWRWIDDPIFRRNLQNWVSFVPFGDNEPNFVCLLQNTACPVVIVQEVYDRHRQHLDALFACSGMDMARLQMMQEDPRQAQMTRII